MKFAQARIPSEVLFAAICTASTPARAVREYVPILKSLWAGTTHLIRKLCRGDAFVVASKLRKSVSEEALFVAIVGHFELIRLLNRSGARALAKQHPNYVNKYVAPYLAKSFSQKSRKEILKFHHQYLAEHVTELFYHKILQSPSILWKDIIDGNRYAISLSFDAQWHAEGDLSLCFEMNEVTIYQISFTIVPGNLIGCPAVQALLVSRAQGKKGQAEAIRIATRACRRVAPPHLLMAAVQSIAGYLSNIDT